MKEFIWRKGLIFPLLALLGVLLIIGVCRGESQTAACAVYLDNELVCIVKDAAVAKQELQELCTTREKTLGQAVETNGKIEYKTIMADRKAIMEKAEARIALANNLGFITSGATIEVNGKPVVTVASDRIAGQVLERLKEGYSACQSQEKVISVAFEEQVKVSQAMVPTHDITSPDKALEILRTGTDTPVTYEVKEGDSLWLIARRHDMHVVDIKAANQLQDEKLQLGQKLTLHTTEPEIHVVTVVEGSRTEKIPYQTKVIVDKSSSSVKVKQQGKNGEKKVDYRVTLKNGTTVEKQVTAEKILTAATDQVVVKGQRIVVASRGTGSGSLSWPVFGKINSYFGSRGGSHKGLDIDGNTGDPIRAADGGRVVFAGRSGGYGLMVEINHGNGVSTRYAHCSRLLVSAGERVAKGEVIARLGSTGRSTGPHLHFEVINNGSQRNPLGYLR